MKKLVFAAALTFAAMAAAQAMPIARFDLKQISFVAPAADSNRVSYGSRSRTYRAGRYGYYSDDLNAGRENFCPFGWYVACVYSNTYCWNRCY